MCRRVRLRNCADAHNIGIEMAFLHAHAHTHDFAIEGFLALDSPSASTGQVDFPLFLVSPAVLRSSGQGCSRGHGSQKHLHQKNDLLL